MISVVISSVSKQDLQLVKANISATIGVPHEVIAIDNSDGKRGICEVYNIGTQQARFGLLCFMHEDIEFVTHDWGNKVVEIFRNSDIGLIGIAGGGYKSLTPSSWYNYHLQENGGFYCNIIQGFKHTGKPDQHDLRNPRNEAISQVAAVDGCWMCTRRELAKKYPFDQNLLQKFHGYDIDFSIMISKVYKVAVTYEILLRHFSEGNFDESWMREIIKVHKKWSDVLPINIDNIPEKHLKRIERDSLEHFIERQFNKGYSKKELAGIIWSLRKSRVATFSFPFKLLKKLWKM